MSIVASVITVNRAQIDARRRITERHTDHLGAVFFRTYLAAVGADVNAALAAYAVVLAASITASEISDNITEVRARGSLATVSLLYSTAAQNFAALRASYQNATQAEAIMIGDFLSARTDAQLQTAFGMTAGQVTTLRTNKLTPAASAAATIRAAAGQ